MDTSPSAFPCGDHGEYQPTFGMSLRDYFAGQALVGLLAHQSGEDPHKSPAMAYALADAMLKARDAK